MTIPDSWISPTCLKQAASVQHLLAQRVRLEDEKTHFKLIGGMDVSNNLYDPHKMVYAACVTLDQNTRSLQAKTDFAHHQPFPYISGFLGFREAPALVKAFDQLCIKPDVILVDGHGISHPRRLGIASHIGVLLDIPTIGVAKNILVGQPEYSLGNAVGDRVPLVWKEEKIGVLLRTKAKCHPLIISAGHKITLETAIDVVLKNLAGYRLPEATRAAHAAANACRQQNRPNNSAIAFQSCHL